MPRMPRASALLALSLLLLLLLPPRPAAASAHGDAVLSHYSAHGSHRSHPPPPLRPTVLAFGDSITQYGWSQGGWVARLAEHYSRKADVLNRGYGGYNTRLALASLLPLVAPEGGHPPALAVVFFGANDAALPGTVWGRTEQHTPLPEYEENLGRIVAALLERGAGAVVVAAPPPVHEPALHQPGARNLSTTRAYALAALGVGGALRAKGLRVATVDTFKVFEGSGEGWGARLFRDGLHFSAAGDELFFGALVGAVEAAFPALAPTAMGQEAPDFNLL